jgi:hypothetical protein
MMRMRTVIVIGAFLMILFTNSDISVFEDKINVKEHNTNERQTFLLVGFHLKLDCAT